MASPTTARTAGTKQATKPDWAMSKPEFERAWREREGLPQRRRRWPWVFVVLLIAVGIGYFYYSTQMTPAPVAEAAPPPEPELVMQINSAEMAVVEPQVLQRTVRVIGNLAPIRQSQLTGQVNGRIEAVRVQPGDAVAAGDVLVQVDVETLTLERDQVRNSAEATRAQLHLAELQLERVQALIGRGVTTASSLDEAEVNVTALRANLSALEDQVSGAELRLANATIRAPFDGVVSARAVEPGQYVTTGAALLTIVDLTRMEMQGYAPVGAGAQLRPGQKVQITVDDIAHGTFPGEVVRINPVADQGTRTIPVYINIDNADGMLLGGMFGTGQIVVEEEIGALAVPTAALREDAEGFHLLRIEEGHLKAVTIEIGGTWSGGLTSIATGLEPGQTIVTAPLPELQGGDAVRIVED